MADPPLANETPIEALERILKVAYDCTSDATLFHCAEDIRKQLEALRDAQPFTQAELRLLAALAEHEHKARLSDIEAYENGEGPMFIRGGVPTTCKIDCEDLAKRLRERAKMMPGPYR